MGDNRKIFCLLQTIATLTKERDDARKVIESQDERIRELEALCKIIGIEVTE